MDALDYRVSQDLRDGTQVRVRALRAEDAPALLAAVGRMSDTSVVRRFFAPRNGFTEAEVARFVDVDGERQVALVAEIDDEGTPAIIGGARYIVLEPGVVEMACAVEDRYQGRGLGAALLRHLGTLARAAGIREVRADVLAENQPMLRLLRGSGLPVAQQREPGAVHLTLSLEPRSAP